MTGRTAPSHIEVIGADANNLRCVDAKFPIGGVTVVTGVSGSGKSSLLAKTVAAEGSRRTRTFLGTSQRELERDEVNAFIGPMPPSVFVGQRGFRPSVRTTVGTATGFLSVLRRLFLLAARPWSEGAHDDVPPPGAQVYAEWLLRHHRGPAQIFAVPVRQKRTDGAAAVERLRRHGATAIRIYSETDPPRLKGEGRERAIDAFRPLNPAVQHTIEAHVATVDTGARGSSAALHDALRRAFEAGDGTVVVMLPGAADAALQGPFGARLDSERHWVHPASPEIFFRPSAHLLSFNAPGHEESGACPACQGTGLGRRLREDRLVVRPDRSMRGGAFALWTEKNYKHLNIQHETINGLDGMSGFSPDRPWATLPAAARALILDGAGDEPVQDLDAAGRKFGRPRPFPGFRRVILEKAAGTSRTAEALRPFVEEGSCEACGGTRWSAQARALRVGALSVDAILATPLARFAEVAQHLRAAARTADSRAAGLVEVLEQRAAALCDVGLGYLAAERGMLNVSGGESRRIRLARVIGAAEAGLCLLFDEPARGLHECDLPGLGGGLERLRGRHTVILNEHREQLWRIADSLIEVGPGAGAAGGEIVSSGPPPQRRSPRPAPPESPRRRRGPAGEIAIKGATLHNLHGVDCSVPLGLLTCICGVSGSGKSSFVRGVLAPAAAAAHGSDPPAADAGRSWRSARGFEQVDAIEILDQQMPPPNRRSLVATTTGLYDRIRKAFAAAPAAKQEGLGAADFSINSGGGRCEICLGLGVAGEDEAAGRCTACGGSRFGPEVLAVRVHGFNIRELLDTPVHALRDAIGKFGIGSDLLDAMTDLGIGYIALGRRTDSLSGGELQRLLLAMRLAAPAAGSTLFILDEPAAGLHPKDVLVLIRALERVVADGRHSLVVIDHDLELIRSADWLIEFGPGAGADGGQVVFEGTAEALFSAGTPTGMALRGDLPKRPSSRPRREPDSGRPPAAPEEQAARIEALLRALITGDVLPGADAGEGTVEPVAILDEDRWAGHAAWEVAGLDKELPKLLLDLQRPPACDREERLIEAWRREPGAWLAVHPLLGELAVWGGRVPAAAWNEAKRRMSKQGLHIAPADGPEPDRGGGASPVRASGTRFSPASQRDEERRAALRDALAIGGGYAELRSGAGRVLAAAGDRMVDLEAGLVGPARPVPADFSRHEPRGRCPGCNGTGSALRLDNALLIRTEFASPLEPEFLTPEAGSVTRGIRPAALIPLLRRLEKERMLSAGAPFAEWDKDEKALLLHGCWTRPGHGTFLKNAKADPAEVSSWLRWNGLYREIWPELDRSKHGAWAKAVRDSAEAVTCPTCAGTGLKPHAALLKVGTLAFPQWTKAKDARKYALLEDLEAETVRQREAHRRLLRCLRPLRDGGGASDIFGLAVTAFTTMRAARAAS